MTAWLDDWPSWSGRWYGWILRVAIAGAGTLYGAVLVWIAGFGASFKTSPPEWGFEETSILVAGLLMVFVSIWVLVRPSRASLVALAASIFGTLVLGGSI